MEAAGPSTAATATEVAAVLPRPGLPGGQALLAPQPGLPPRGPGFFGGFSIHSHQHEVTNHMNTPTPVSAELNELLNRLAGDFPAETANTKASLTEEEKSASYLRCTWWSGCYYCQNSDGSWTLQYCVAKQ
jgi:hypothetical protein